MTCVIYKLSENTQTNSDSYSFCHFCLANDNDQSFIEAGVQKMFCPSMNELIF